MRKRRPAFLGGRGRTGTKQQKTYGSRRKTENIFAAHDTEKEKQNHTTNTPPKNKKKKKKKKTPQNKKKTNPHKKQKRKKNKKTKTTTEKIPKKARRGIRGDVLGK